MALTLLEAAKLHTGDDLRATVIEIYAEASDILRVLPFEEISGNALKYNQEDTLPGIGFRGLNEGYTESTGVINPVTESLFIAGGDLDVDKFLTDTMGMDQRAVQEAMKVKALAHKWSYTFIKGDSVSNPKEFDGLQIRITGTQKIQAGTTANGTPLSLAKMDEAIDAVDQPTHLIMSKAMRRRFTTAARNQSVGGHVSFDKDEFGRPVTKYNDLPILLADGNGSVFPTLAFDEAATSGTATATSIYVVSFQSQMCSGIQNGTPSVRDLGELQTKPSWRTRVEWYAGISIWHPRAVARLWSISDAAITA